MGEKRHLQERPSIGRRIRDLFELLRSSVMRAVREVKLIVTPTSFSRDAAAECERRCWGQRGHGQTALFWSTTIWISAALGACSAMNGFSPLDLLLESLGHPVSCFEGVDALFPCVLTAVLGCVAFNAFVAQRHVFNGYAKAMYLGSIGSGALFITLSHAAFLFLGGGASS